MNTPCPCSPEKSYAECCQLIHQDIKKAKTAEQLMRSRYSAFVLADGDFLMKSHHLSTRKIKDKTEIVKWAKSVKWLKLEIIQIIDGKENDAEGSVQFKAIFKEGFHVRSINENSRFLKEEGVWYYVGIV